MSKWDPGDVLAAIVIVGMLVWMLALVLFPHGLR